WPSPSRAKYSATNFRALSRTDSVTLSSVSPTRFNSFSNIVCVSFRKTYLSSADANFSFRIGSNMPPTYFTISALNVARVSIVVVSAEAFPPSDSSGKVQTDSLVSLL
uniref:MSP domain-containing protein n=1 Tax=Brugia timori TaxID=42155 RepID=A0A0R3Q8B3_9BILA